MKTLLLIDDDTQIRTIIRVQLRKMDLEILEAEGKADALAVLGSRRVDIVICDIKMKDSNGIELLQIIHRERPGIPVIMLTGFIDKHYHDQVLDEGGFDLLTKPVKREKLVEVVGNALKAGENRE
jgi:DNA-binding NtrC family response regulator